MLTANKSRVQKSSHETVPQAPAKTMTSHIAVSTFAWIKQMLPGENKKKRMVDKTDKSPVSTVFVSCSHSSWTAGEMVLPWMIEGATESTGGDNIFMHLCYFEKIIGDADGERFGGI